MQVFLKTFVKPLKPLQFTLIHYFTSRKFRMCECNSGMQFPAQKYLVLRPHFATNLCCWGSPFYNCACFTSKCFYASSSSLKCPFLWGTSKRALWAPNRQSDTFFKGYTLQVLAARSCERPANRGPAYKYILVGFITRIGASREPKVQRTF